jgi:hypothetical protein
MKIQAPNGDTIEFPDGTPDSVILDVMRREYGGPASGAPPAPPPAPAPAPGAGMPSIPGFTPMATTTTPTGEYNVRQTPELMASSPRHPPTSGVSSEEDLALSLLTGARTGIAGIPGIPGSLEALGRAGINLATQTGLGRDVVSPEPVLPTAADTAGPAYEPRTRAGRYAHSIGQFAPGALLPGSVAARALLNTTLPAVASEAAGQATEGTQLETPSRVAAALLAPYAPRAAMRAITPLPATAGRTQQAGVLAAEGVDLTAGQRTGSRPLRWAESSARDMPFAGAPIGAITERQGEQLTRALLRRVGETGDDALATPQVLAAARARIGAEFDRVTTHPLPLNARTSGDIATRLGAAFRQYLEQVPTSAHRPFVEGFMRDMLDAMTTPGGRLRPNISGERVQHFRSRLATAARETTDPEYAAFLRAARETLDDIYGATLPANEAAAWAAARQHWRHLLVLEDAVAGSAMGTPYGTASPASLRRASKTGNPQAFAEGRGT